MIACAPTISPPAPRPCSARNAISSPIVWRRPRQHRAGQEDQDRGQEHGLAPVHVAELAVQRRRRGRREQVGGDDPATGARGRRGRRRSSAARSRRSSGRARPGTCRASARRRPARARGRSDVGVSRPVPGMRLSVPLAGAHARSPSCRERKTRSGASSWVSVPSATARAPASSSAPKPRRPFGRQRGENSPACRARSAPQRRAEDAAAARALASVSGRLRRARSARRRRATRCRAGAARRSRCPPPGGKPAAPARLLEGLRLDRVDQRLARREVAVDGRAADARRAATSAIPAFGSSPSRRAATSTMRWTLRAASARRYSTASHETPA